MRREKTFAEHYRDGSGPYDLSSTDPWPTVDAETPPGTPIVLTDLAMTYITLEERIEQAGHYAHKVEEAYYADKLERLNDERTLQRLREKAQAEGVDLCTVANQFLGRPPQPVPPRTSRQDLTLHADAAGVSTTDVLAAQHELERHIEATRKEEESINGN